MSNNAWRRVTGCACAVSFSALGFGQVPDLYSSFEMGGRALGMGGSLYSNTADVSATYWNPAGLAFLTEAAGQINFRNRPDTRTSYTGGPYFNPDESSRINSGSMAVTFGGFAIPLAGGTLGFSYAMGGWANQRAIGFDLNDPNDPNDPVDREDNIKLQEDFYTIAWARKAGGVNIGAGVVVGRQYVRERSLWRKNSGTIVRDVDVEDEGTGVGGIVGVQFMPSQGGNISVGFSYRSEIKLNGMGEASGYASEIPARLQGGLAWRVDNLRGGQDFLIGGLDAAYFFPANSGDVFERKGQISAGIGFEYNWIQSFGAIPIRIGFRTTDSGGDLFSNRDVLTFGIGYRPREQKFSVDLNIAAASGQSRPDMALSLSFLIGK